MKKWLLAILLIGMAGSALAQLSGGISMFSSVPPPAGNCTPLGSDFSDTCNSVMIPMVMR